MTLRVEDLKPGDVVRMEFTIVRHDNYSATADLGGGRRIHIDDADLAAGNAERVQRPRPVRKGDEVARTGDDEPWTFVAMHAGWAVCEKRGTYTGWNTLYVAHANGDPIDWEDSE